MSDFSTLSLATPRLLLRPLGRPDAPAVHALHADAQALRFWSTPPWQDPKLADELIDRDLKAHAAGDYLRLGIVRWTDQRLIGLCTLFAFYLPSRRAEIGYILARNAWGQGFMHEALTALLDFGFGALGLNRVEADIDPRNTASRNTLRRLGFVQEGRLRERWIVGAEVSDTALHGLLRADWLARMPADGPAPAQRG